MDEKNQDEGQPSLPAKNNTVIWIIVVIVVIVIGIAYFSRGSYKAPATQPNNPPASSTQSQPMTDNTQSPAAAPQNAPQAASTAVMIQNFAFSPASLTIKKGETVTWTNEDSVPHQIASDTNAFSGNQISKGQTYSFTFNQAGTFPYHCAIHPSMKGTITVQ